MSLPKMILFDYGQTLMAERDFDAVAGDEALLRYADNPRGVTASGDSGSGRCDDPELRGEDYPDRLHTHVLEIHE